MGFELESLDDSEKTSEQLEILRDNLSRDLETAINSGDAGAMLRLDKMIHELKPRIFAAQVAELKQGLTAANERKAEIEAEIVELEKLKKAANADLAKAIILYEEKQKAVRQVEVSLYIADSELIGLRENQRDMRKRLEKFVADKLQEVNANAQRFETI